MSLSWTFAPSSEALLKRCLDAAAPENLENKWVKHFKKKRLNLLKSEPKPNNSVDKIKKGDIALLPDAKEDTKPVILYSEIDETFFESIETEPIFHFDFLVEKCVKDHKLFIELAEKLSGNTVEKICNHILSKKEVNEIFLEQFYTSFFPAYLEQEYSLVSLDLLVRAEKSNPSLFKKLLKLLFKNIEIPSKLFQDFFETLNEHKKSEFTSSLLEIDLSPKEFNHHLFTIYIAYKDSKKTDRINNFIFTNLLRNCEDCVSNKNYGKLILVFLQVMKDNPRNDIKKLEKVLEMHRSPFKKPCLNIFNEIVNKS